MNENTLVGTPVDDILQGTDQSDLIIGDEGNDTLIGGRGNDELMGLPGNDVFVFQRGDGHDRIFSWGPPGSAGQLQFGADIGLADVTVRAEGNDLLLTLDTNGGSV